MTDAQPLLGSPGAASLDPSIAMQELVRLQLQIQSRIAAVRNASEAALSFQAIQEQNVKIRELLLELEERLQVRIEGSKPHFSF